MISYLLVVVLIGVVYNTWNVLRLREEVMELIQVADRLEPVADEHPSEETFLSDEQIQREKAFTARIEQLKNELALQDNTTRVGYSADELHPGVINLPHNIIAQEHRRIPDVEYAE